MIFLAIGVVLGLWAVGSPIERDMSILILMVSLGIDAVNHRINKTGGMAGGR